MQARPPRHVATVLTVAVSSLMLAGCGGGDGPDGSGDSSRVSVVASTNVWGDVAESVGGDAVTVTSLISGPSVDPHSFEASSKTLLSVANADLVIENGGGYDDFMGRMLGSSRSEARVINAVKTSGTDAVSGSAPNEHVWFDLSTVGRVADAIAQDLGDVRPEEADRFTARAAQLRTRLHRLAVREAQLKRRVAGERIAVTEAVPLFLTEAVGLVNATPEEFSEAVEEGDDVSVRVLQETLDLFAEDKVVALVYNEQTSGPVTEEVLSAAREADIPVVPVTETLPPGLDYVRWMQRTLAALAHALERR
jgi:zinc/manganese transport system substrate-binding protein